MAETQRKADTPDDNPTVLDVDGRSQVNPQHVAGLCRVGDAIAEIDRGLSALADADDRSRYKSLSKSFLTLRLEATHVKVWDLAEIALAGERIFASAVLKDRGLSDDERGFFENVRTALQSVAANPDEPRQLDIDLIGDAFDHLLDDLGVD